VCFDFLYNFCLKRFSFQVELSEIWSKMYIGLHVQYPLFLSDFNETRIFSTVFRKICNLKFHENPSSGGSSCSMRTDGHEEADSHRNFANAPQKKLTNGVSYPLLDDIYRRSKFFFTERHESLADCTTDEQYYYNISQHTGYCTENVITL
jgi:hypothetical protein